ncbi:MAG TPA: hypothetical protein VIE86_04340 [Nitrososphaera sp.]
MTKINANEASFLGKKLSVINFSAVSIMLLLLSGLFFGPQQVAYSQSRLVLLSEEDVYNPGETLTIYGASEPNDLLVIRLYDPAGKAIRIDNIVVDENGFFRESIYEWPEPSRDRPFGTYVVEAISGAGRGTQLIEIIFAESLEVTTDGGRIPKIHTLAVKLDSPDQVTTGTYFRIYVQVTFDGALVNSESSSIAEILGSSHIHSGRGDTIVLADKFVKLHEGLYYADVKIDTEGAYVIHAIVFNRGLLSHDSKVVSVSLSTVSTIQESVRELDLRLNSTNRELQRLQAGLDDTNTALNDTKSAITDSVEDAQRSIREEIVAMSDASGQINAIILPVLALISVIIALQISLFARIRASYK